MTPQNAQEDLPAIIPLAAGHDLNVAAARIVLGDDLALRPADTSALQSAMSRAYRVVDKYGRRKFGLGFDPNKYNEVAHVIDYPPREEWGRDPDSDRLVWYAYVEREGKPWEADLDAYLAAFRREPPRLSDSPAGADLIIEALLKKRWASLLHDSRAMYTEDEMRDYRLRGYVAQDLGAPVACQFIYYGTSSKNRVTGYGDTRALAVVRGGIKAALETDR